MKIILIYLLLINSFSISLKAGYALTDSLPRCIKEMKTATESFVTEYNYKGKRWFVFTKIDLPTEPNGSYKMYYTKFYDAHCRLVCSWTKGGIIGNKVTPDTIEKEKIKKVGIVPDDTIIKQNERSNALPDSIIKLALTKNAQEVKEYLYQDKILYTFRYAIYNKPLPQKGSVTIDNPYYDKNGKAILIYKSAIQGAFTRAEHWVPNSVKRSDVTEIRNGVWLREKDNFKKL